MSDEEDFGDWDDSIQQEAIQLAAVTPARLQLQQRTLFGGMAQVQTSPGSASYALARNPLQQQRRGVVAEPPTHHQLDQEAIRTWVYPTNYPQRDYQFNMIQKALYSNLLIALPTGLGKTFIAAVVMYNWYRWAPASKLVFVAPTKPLVNQQIDACYQVCGIPARDMAEMTGGVDISRRRAAYAGRRVFFLTPQTLENDLRKGLIKAEDISCMVVDEAHHATGKYAYVECVRLIYEKHASVRILALTATPGKDVETVQAVVDALHISRIEIRSDTSIDIRAYVHGKDIETVLLDLPPELVEVQNHLVTVMRPMVGKLVSKGVGLSGEPTKLTRFTVKSACDRYRLQVDRSRGFAVASTEAALGALAAAMQMLNEHGLRPFATLLLDEADDGTYRSKIPGTVRADPNFKRMLAATKRLCDDPNYAGHPKLDYLSGILLNHFQQAAEAASLPGAPRADAEKETRAMVFTSLRVSADAILKMLRAQQPLIRATPFFGQGKGKSADEVGMTQKEQKEVIGKFKKGVYNVIVATSVGEEGLDIGEVDLIVCYDSSSSPARMLQRMGRTGRKREGQVFVLCLRGKEEMAFLKAKDAHRVMQKKIEQGVDLQLCADVRRIIPADVQPECRKRLLEVPKDDKPSDRDLKAVIKRKREKKTFAPPPQESVLGFVTAGSLGGGGGGNSSRPSSAAPSRRSRLQALDAKLWDFDSRPGAGLLTVAEQAELERRYATGQEPDNAGHPDEDTAPLDRTESVFRSTTELRRLTRTHDVPHGVRTRAVLELTRDTWRRESLGKMTARWRAIVDARDNAPSALDDTDLTSDPILQHTQTNAGCRLTQPSPLANVSSRSVLGNIPESDDDDGDLGFGGAEDGNSDQEPPNKRMRLSQLRREGVEDDNDDLPDVGTLLRSRAATVPIATAATAPRSNGRRAAATSRPSSNSAQSRPTGRQSANARTAGVTVRRSRIVDDDDDD